MFKKIVSHYLFPVAALVAVSVFVVSYTAGLQEVSADTAGTSHPWQVSVGGPGNDDVTVFVNNARGGVGHDGLCIPVAGGEERWDWNTHVLFIQIMDDRGNPPNKMKDARFTEGTHWSYDITPLDDGYFTGKCPSLEHRRSQWDASQTWTDIPPGNYTIYVALSDGTSNVGTTFKGCQGYSGPNPCQSKLTFTVAGSPCDFSCSLDITPEPGETDQALNFEADIDSGSPSNCSGTGTNRRYRIDWDNDGSYDTSWSSWTGSYTRSWTHAYEDQGNKTAKAQVEWQNNPSGGNQTRTCSTDTVLIEGRKDRGVRGCRRKT